MLYGGGLDSASALVLWPETIGYLLHFDYGQKAAACERDAMNSIARRYGKRAMSVKIAELGHYFVNPILVGSESEESRDWRKDGVVNMLDGRNIMLFGHAVMFAARMNFDTILTGFHREPIEAPFRDATGQFVEAFNFATRFGMQHRVRITSPIANRGWDSAQAIAEAYKIDPAAIGSWRYNHTCYEGVRGGCQKCSHCRKREETMRAIKGGAVDVPY